MLSMPLGFEGPSLSGKLTRRQLLHAGGLSMLGLACPVRQCASDPGVPRVLANRERRRPRPRSPASSL
jgi:hypothetical protein